MSSKTVRKYAQDNNLEEGSKGSVTAASKKIIAEQQAVLEKAAAAEKEAQEKGAKLASPVLQLIKGVIKESTTLMDGPLKQEAQKAILEAWTSVAKFFDAESQEKAALFRSKLEAELFQVKPDEEEE